MTVNRLGGQPIVIGKRGVSHVGAGLYLHDGMAVALGGVTACGDLDPDFEFPTTESELGDVTCPICRSAVGRDRGSVDLRPAAGAPLPPASLPSTVGGPQ